MKCKDCIHYTAHKHFYFGEDEKDFDEYFNDDNVESQCPEFEDKKEWLKLPCKVGDTAYFITNRNTPKGTKEHIVETTIEKIGVRKSGMFIKLSANAMYETSCNSIGKTVFLTLEEAEKALAERSGK